MYGEKLSRDHCWIDIGKLLVASDIAKLSLEVRETVYCQWLAFHSDGFLPFARLSE